MAKKKTEKQYIDLWAEYKKNIYDATPVDLNETPAEREKRKKRLEAKKPDKFDRIESMEDDNEDGNIIFNEKEKDNPMMVEMEDQWLGVSPKAKEMDGPDAVEGGKHKLDLKTANDNTTYEYEARESRKY